MSPGQLAWERACCALDLLAANPKRLRGMTVRARSGPVRDVFLEALTKRFGTIQKIHPAISRDALLGGLDFTETLATGRIAKTKGVLERDGLLVLAMSERCPPELAAIIGARVDADDEFCVVLLDEGSEPDEAAPTAISERLAFHVSLDGIGRLEAKPPPKRRSSGDLDEHSLIGRKVGNDPARENLTRLAAKLGIDTLRIPYLALHAARAHAILEGRSDPNSEDIQKAAELVLAPRALHLPEPETPEQAPTESNPESKSNSDGETISDDMLIEAVQAALPPELLENLRNSQTSRATGTGAGQRKKGNRRGRPIPSRPGRIDGKSRLDIIATLRAAAPWQAVRGRLPDGPLKIYPSDIHLKRYEERSDRLIVFAVDASGSAAMARLGEAKGAVELMLARAYATRDHVALIAFRGSEAELLLPPTRSLVQTKRRLAALPGGGGTPLAHGLKAAAELGQRAQVQGLTPTLAVLTDGRGNIALDGSANRAAANTDAETMARWIRSLGIPAVVIDLGNRPQAALATLAATMDAKYIPLPRATAERMHDALETAMDHGLGT